MTIRKRLAFGAVFLVFALAACQQQPADPLVPQVDTPLPPSDRVMVTGCIQQTGHPEVFLLAISEAAGAAERPPGAVEPRGEITRPRLDPVAPGRPTPEPDPPVIEGVADPARGETATTEIVTYRLVNTTGIPLDPHVGEAVEVTGTLGPAALDQPADPGAPDVGTGSDQPPAAADGAEREFPTLAVSSIRPLGRDCLERHIAPEDQRTAPR